MHRASSPIDRRIEAFISRWSAAPISERSKYQSFLNQLCTLIGAPAPDEDRIDDLGYTYERPVRFMHDDGSATSGFIDLYKAGCFVLEAKQSKKRQSSELPTNQLELSLAGGRRAGYAPAPKGWDPVLRRAKRQAEDYAKALDEWPPFIIVVDVGRVLELYADFSGQGKNYVPYPDRTRFRLNLDDLRRDEIRERLRLVWENPAALDPASRTAAVTQDIAALLARLTRSLERSVAGGWEAASSEARAAQAERVATFLTQCIFAMFAEDVGLLGRRAFQKLIDDHRGKAGYFHLAAKNFFEAMDQGGYSLAAQQKLRHFNGGVFKDKPVVEVTEDDLELLSKAAARDWRDVEPAIFGTLLEHALDAKERGQLGAHYTPRAYVERLVIPTIIEPLREDWDIAESAAVGEWQAGREHSAIQVVREYHRRLCATRVLDPACGTGNFLYVALKLMKELEGDVLAFLQELGVPPEPALTVSPAQFHGLEKEPHAARIAELVLWIGYLQWHLKTFGEQGLAEPILQDTGTIKVGDALLAAERQEWLTDETGKPLSGRQDPEATRLHPITGAVVPDLTRRLGIENFINPRPVQWPDADFIVGNPPFIAGKDVRRELGDGYAKALWASRGNRFKSADLVTYWWDQAADLLTQPGSRLRRFGFISTNSVTQKFSRRVLEQHLRAARPVRLVYAVPNHPWVKGPRKAAVRIAMTVAEAGGADPERGRYATVIREEDLNTDAPIVELVERGGLIGPDLTVGTDVTVAGSLVGNADICSPGVKLHGAGFIVSREQAVALGLGRAEGLEQYIRPYVHGRDLAGRQRGVMVIDLYPLEAPEVRRRFPAVYQHILARVKPERDANPRAIYRERWLWFGEPRSVLRDALEGLERFITTPETARHRWFTFVEGTTRPDNKLVSVASDDGYVLGVLSSRVHVTWATAAGGRLGVGNDPVYSKTTCFDPFPFPIATESQEQIIRSLATELDALRSSAISEHRFVTMTGIYNVRSKLTSGAELTDADRAIYEVARVGIISDLHEQLDAAVAAAYGWPADLHQDEILSRLAALNEVRQREEATGQIRWIRKTYQSARVSIAHAGIKVAEQSAEQAELPMTLPYDERELARSVLAALRRTRRPATALELARRFAGGEDASVILRLEHALVNLAQVGAVTWDAEKAAWFAARRAA